MPSGTVGSSEVGVKLSVSDEQERKATCLSAPIFCPFPTHGTVLAVPKWMEAGLWPSCSSCGNILASELCFPLEHLLYLR